MTSCPGGAKNEKHATRIHEACSAWVTTNQIWSRGRRIDNWILVIGRNSEPSLPLSLSLLLVSGCAGFIFVRARYGCLFCVGLQWLLHWSARCLKQTMRSTVSSDTRRSDNCFVINEARDDLIHACTHIWERKTKYVLFEKEICTGISMHVCYLI